jgi:RHS repeat-associated protein
MNSQWIAAGDDAIAGWIYTLQAYDWKGRPTVTTNADGTQRTMTYGGCGCAGSEVVTARDERGRQRRTTHDVLGRLAKVEELNWDGTVYATANYSYNSLDNLTSINHEGQIRSFGYDGYGRLVSRITPEQGTMTYSYFADDTVRTMTDARGATTTLTYNGRHLATAISYGVPAGVAATSNVAFGYDVAGNRTSMTDGLGSVSYGYDQLSRLTSETRTFTNVSSFTLSYNYNLAGELTGITDRWGAQVSYSYDKIGRPTEVTSYENFGGSGPITMTNLVSGISYRAFGLKQMAYANGRTLSVAYDNRLRLTRWDVPGVMGWNYSYSDFGENTGRVTFAQSLNDSTLDRSYHYDHVGRLDDVHTGAEARAALQGQGATPDGPYSHHYWYDQFGNMGYRVGWGGSFPSYLEQWLSYTNNQLNTNPFNGVPMQYDQAGNLKNDGYQSFDYDATGQQTYASSTNLSQSYDGDGLRAKKTENNATIYYLRSSVLGGQVVAELNPGGEFARGYAYLGGQMVAIQANSTVTWVHQDPITKSQRLTDANGNVTSTIDLDPWGGETWRSSNSAFQPQRYTTYTRDSNGGDDAMFRRYQSSWNRFAQPDPYDGSYSLTDPQSFNRYAYVQNDPVNFVDPTGLSFIPASENGWDRFVNPTETFINEAMRDFVADYNWFMQEETGGVPFDGFPLISFGGPRGLVGGLSRGVQQRRQTANECRAEALNKLADELGARQELYPSDSEKAVSLVAGGVSGAGAGGRLLGPGGAVIGGLVGIAVGGMRNNAKESNIEAGPVSRFKEAAKECDKIKRQEMAEARSGPFVQAGVPQQFVVTRQFGTFAMYSYTIWRPTLPGGQHYEQHGPNPTDPVRRW